MGWPRRARGPWTAQDLGVAFSRLPFARFLLVCGNKIVRIRNFQQSGVPVMSAAERVDIPFFVLAIGLLNVSAHQVIPYAVDGLAKSGRLATEVLPVFQP